MKEYSIKPLPIQVDLETKAILRKVVSANRFLAELKGIVSTIPNEAILINALVLQEAKDSSAIENIITTHDELYKAELFEQKITSISAKEVQNYSKALKAGFRLVVKHKILTNQYILQIQAELEANNAGFRKLPGTALKNQQTSEVIYMPPQDHDTIILLMTNLEKYINENIEHDVDPLVKLAIIHHQFESIHPFYDGNGRTGRIINILYLVIKDLLNLPILYLSRYIIENKSEYYRLLQDVRNNDNWEGWVLFMLDAIEQTSIQTILQIKQINELMSVYKNDMQRKVPKLYSKDLLENLFKHPYTKIEYVMNDLQIHRETASTYLNILVENGFLEKHKIGRDNFYINRALYDLFSNKNFE